MTAPRSLAVALAAAVLTLAAPAMGADNHRIFALGTQSNSGEMGTVTLTAMGEKTKVDIALVNAPDAAQPAHIHEGSCAKLNPKPKYPLTSVADGVSTTTVDVPLAELVKGGLAVNVHKSTSDLQTYVACGDLAKK
ncbi:MAG TPA: hypothetical protein VGD01_02030 [Candidatus Elarobacter sp.]|jgi:hypothetical protein